MKILIVDDQPRRYDRLIDVLGSNGISRDDIDLVGSAIDARDCMDRRAYDLLILDILLPLRPESEESAQNAIDLLFELREGEWANSPRYILGITADRGAAGEALQQFESWCWTVLDFSPSNDEWINRVGNCAKYILDKAKHEKAAEPRVDLAIVCALSDPEQAEVLKLPWNWQSPRPLDDVTFVRDGWVQVDSRRISVCTTVAPRMGMVSAALRSASIISHLRPKILAMTGICAGVKGKVKIGDVLFVDPAWDYQSGKRVRDAGSSRFSIRPHQLAAPTRIRAHIEQIRDDTTSLAAMAAEFPGKAPGLSEVILGPVASGSAVLADGEAINEVRLQQHQELIGIEMEAYGMYAAAYAAAEPQPLCFALKSVCDFGDSDKNDVHQRYAAYASARVLQSLIERYGPRLL